MSTHGILLGGTLGTWSFCRLRNKNVLSLADELVVPAAFIMGLGRMGNFIDGQIVGSVTDAWWAVKFPDTEGFSLQIASVSGMIAPAMCGWAPLWSERHSHSYDLSEEQVQACMGKRGPDRSKAVNKLCPQLITRTSRSAAFLTGPACQPVIDWCNLQVGHPVVLYDGVKNLMLVPVLLLVRRIKPPRGVMLGHLSFWLRFLPNHHRLLQRV